MYISFNPWALVVLPCLFILLMKWPKRSDAVTIENSRVGILRRVAAFYVDAFVGLIGVLPFISMVALATEYIVTGQWQWSYARDFSRWSDIVSLLAVLIGIYAMFYYFKWHFDRQRQTVGQYLFRFRLVPMNENPRIGLRMLIAWVNLAWWPIWPWTIFQRKQDYWWDTASHIKARNLAMY